MTGVVAKEIVGVHRVMVIVKERCMSILEIMKHDLPGSPLFNVYFTTKPDRPQLVGEHEQHLALGANFGGCCGIF